MTDFIGRLRGYAAVEASGSGVYFKIPSRKCCALFNLKEEVEFRKEQDQESEYIYATCGIVGQLHSGRKHLGYRFGRINDEDIDAISDDPKLCYCGNLPMVVRGRPVTAVIKAYIIPPPYDDFEELKKKNPKKEDAGIVPLPAYVRASHEFCCLLFAFDVTKMESYTAAEESMRTLKIAMPDKYFLVGNKCDLRATVQGENEVSHEFARSEARRLGAAGYFECSAKRNINVRSIMEAVARCERDRPHV